MFKGSLSPLGEFLSLRDDGRSIALTETPPYLLQWSNDGQTISHNNQSVSMEQFRGLIEHFLIVAEQQCKELMFDNLPEVDLGFIQDDMTNRRPGFSFVKHPQNGLADAYLQLSTWASTSP